MFSAFSAQHFTMALKKQGKKEEQLLENLFD